METTSMDKLLYMLEISEKKIDLITKNVELVDQKINNLGSIYMTKEQYEKDSKDRKEYYEEKFKSINERLNKTSGRGDWLGKFIAQILIGAILSLIIVKTSSGW